MKPRQLSWRWLLLGLAPFLLALALLPKLIGDTSELSQRIASALSEWTGGKVSFTGPLRVGYFPDVSVRGALVIRDASRLPLVRSVSTEQAKITIDLAQLLLGRLRIHTLRLVQPRIALSSEAAAGQTPHALVVNLFSAGPVGALHIRDGSIEIETAAGPEIIDNVHAHFDTSGAQTEGGAVSGSGSFDFRFEAVRFSFDSGALTADSTSVPVSVVLTSAPGSASMKGTASFEDGLQLDGSMQTKIADARLFLRWLGVDLPQGQSLKDFSASGSMHTNGATITIDEASFQLDGNKAVGLLAVTAGAKPRIEGTLDFERLVVDPYLLPVSSDEVTASLPETKSSFISDWILLRSLDADLRISVDAMRVGTFMLGKGGFTITAKEGALAAEIGEIEFCGGTAAGRLGIKSEQPPGVSAIANLTDITLKPCLDPLGLGIPIAGIGTLKADLGGEGHDIAALKHGLIGEIKFTAQRGSLPVDFGRLTGAKAPIESESWNANQATQFDELNAECRLAASVVWCRMFNMQTRQDVISGAGDLDLGRSTLDWKLSVNRPEANADNDVPKVSIRGAMSQPVIRRTDRSTLGEDASQANPGQRP